MNEEFFQLWKDVAIKSYSVPKPSTLSENKGVKIQGFSEPMILGQVPQSHVPDLSSIIVLFLS